MHARKAVLGQNPAEVAYWERGEWWLAGTIHRLRASIATAL
jgi:hypothetical protein